MTGGFILQLLSIGLVKSTFPKRMSGDQGWGLLTGGLTTTLLLWDSYEKISWWSKVKAGNGWREGEMLNYKVMVRKPIWQGRWKTQAYRIKYHIQQSTVQSLLCFPNGNQMAGWRLALLVQREPPQNSL